MDVRRYLILLTYGSVPLFVDGPAATAYPDELLQDYFNLVHWEVDERRDDVLEKCHIAAVLWLRRHEQLRRFLVGKRGWKEEHTGLYESVYTRPAMGH